WHWVFLIDLPIGALVIIAGLSFMPNLKERCPNLDLKGFLLFSSGLFLSVYGFDRLGHGEHLVGALIGLILGGTLFALYWRYAAFYEKRSEEHTSELQSRFDLVCRLLLEKKKKKII